MAWTDTAVLAEVKDLQWYRIVAAALKSHRVSFLLN
jgi:hypothetical protein